LLHALSEDLTQWGISVPQLVMVEDGYRRFREWSSDLLSGLEAGDPMALVGRRGMEQPIRAR